MPPANIASIPSQVEFVRDNKVHRYYDESFFSMLVSYFTSDFMCKYYINPEIGLSLGDEPTDELLELRPIINSMPWDLFGYAFTINDIDWNQPCGSRFSGKDDCISPLCWAAYRIYQKLPISYVDSKNYIHQTVINHKYLYIDFEKFESINKRAAPCNGVGMLKCTYCGRNSMTPLTAKICGEAYVCNGCQIEKPRCYICNCPTNNTTRPYNTTIKLCGNCFAEFSAPCQSCNLRVWIAYITHDTCLFCTSEVINEYNYHPEPVFLSKSSQNLYFGIELEVEMKPKYGSMTNTIASRFHKDIRKVAYLKKDSSIYNGFEIVSHPGDLAWWEDEDNILFKSIKKLSYTCYSYWPENTGLHVHISRDGFHGHSHIAAFVKFIIAHKFFTAFVAERYQSTQAPFRPEMDHGYYDMVAGRLNPPDRHTAVNLASSQKTVEVRVFKGNMKRERILKSIEFLHAVHAFTNTKEIIEAKTQEAITSFIELKYNLPAFKKFVSDNQSSYPHLAEYIKDYKKDY